MSNRIDFRDFSIIIGNFFDFLLSLKKIKETIGISEVSGRFDLFVRIACKNLDQLHKTIVKKLAIIDGVNNTETFIELVHTDLDHKTLSK